MCGIGAGVTVTIRATRLRTMWDERRETWQDQVSASPAFEQVRAEVISAAAISATDRVVDLGAGAGFLTLPLAERAAAVMAVDLSPQMLAALATETNRRALGNVTIVVADVIHFDADPGTIDVVVSSYALHHLNQRDKRELVRRAHRWLRPGGRIVIADMMFGRGGSARDRTVIREKASALLAKGPGGAWRIAKNAVRFGLRSGTELPASPEFWTTALADAGFTNVRFDPIVAEAGIVVGMVPGA